jgi:serine/threonine-protein kinase
MSAPTPIADRNLIFGLLALQMEFVTREQLLDAMNAWMLHKQTPLGCLLQQRGVLSPRRAALLEGLVEEHVAQHGSDPKASLAALRVEPSVQSALHDLKDAELRASLASLGPGGPNEDLPATVAPFPLPQQGTVRFHRLRPHARGGLGEVFVALDEELHREVALKEIQEQFADQLDARARFLREAEVTGKLEHPGVVPVYGLGAYPDGRPFYAMRLIRGESMQQASKRFHRADEASRRDTTERSLALRELLSRFIAVCNAIAYAHSRGVIHRDLKPANVMLGEFGETIVVDWGLACVLAQPTGDQTVAERPLDPGPASQTPVTERGRIVGTPAYLSPEQAQGHLDRVGVASDVFALGALLYELLTGQPPYTGSKEEVLRLAQRGEVAPARQRKPAVPRALEAVCGKAMAARPENRYPTARALAEEVQRYLADEPVQADREPLTERLRRWGRRHHSLVTSSVVLLLVSVLGLALGLWAVANEQARTAAQRDRAIEAEKRATAHLKLAVANLKLAKKAVDECFNVCKEDPLFQQPRMEKVRKLLLAKTLPFYQQMLKQQPANWALQWEEADQWFRVGYIEGELVETAQARTAYEKARERFLHLVMVQPGVAELQDQLAYTHDNLGVQLAALGKREEALVEHQQARELRLRLVKTWPHRHRYQNALATTHDNLGVVLRKLGRRGEALVEHQQARALRQKLVKAHPDLPVYQQELAHTHNFLGLLLAALGRSKEALLEYRQARSLAHNLLVAHPDLARYQQDLAWTHNNLGILLSDLGKREQALKAYQQARDLQQKLVDAHPNLPVFQEDLANTRGNLGHLLRQLDKRTEALVEFQQARELWQKLAKAHPDLPGYQKSLAAAHNNLGLVLLSLGKREEALVEHQQARELRQKLVKAYPNVSEYQKDLAGTHNNLGALLFELGKHQEALKEYQQARELQQQLVKAHPDLPAYQRDLGGTYNNIGVLLESMGKRTEALVEYQHARDLRRELARAQPDVPEYQEALACTHNLLAVLLWHLGKREQALEEYEQARELWQKLVKTHSDVPEYAIKLGGTCCDLGKRLCECGKVQESVGHFAQAIEQLQGVQRKQPDNATIRLYLYNSYGGRALALTLLGRNREAIADWDQTIRLDTKSDHSAFRVMRASCLSRCGDYLAAAAEAEDLGRGTVVPGNRLYDLARIHAHNARSAGRDPSRPLPERDQRSEEYARKAVTLLKRAAAVGYFSDLAKIAHLNKDSDLAFLRDRRDYQQFRTELKSMK